MKATHAFAGLPVTDFAATYDWYVALFDREADMFPTEGEAVWRLNAGTSVYVVADAGRAGNALLTLAVDDLDRSAARLRAAGFTLTEQAGERAPRRLRTHDPDGNRITFFEDPAAATR